MIQDLISLYTNWRFWWFMWLVFGIPLCMGIGGLIHEITHGGFDNGED